MKLQIRARDVGMTLELLARRVSDIVYGSDGTQSELIPDDERKNRYQLGGGNNAFFEQTGPLTFEYGQRSQDAEFLQAVATILRHDQGVAEATVVSH